MDNKIELIHENSIKILEQLGINVHCDKTIEFLKENGVKVENGRAFFTREQVDAALSKVVSSFEIKARNPKYDVVMDRNAAEYTPGYGCPSIIDADGSVRMALREDYIKFLKLSEVSDKFNISGGIVCQPSDLDASTAHMVMLNDTINYSEKCIITIPGVEKTMRENMEMLSILFGEEDLQENCRSVSLINTTSPLGLDKLTLDTIRVCAEYNQGVIVTPGAMVGTTGPITLAGSLSMGNAEALAAITISQMYRAGMPLIYGMINLPVNLKSGLVSIGSPAYSIMHKYSKLLADYYNMPCRTGGTQSDAKGVSVQSGYESALEIFASRMNGVNFVMHAAGVLDGFKSMSYEKFICDLEIIDMVDYYMADIEVNEETLLFDELEDALEVGNFMEAESTFEFCRSLPWYHTLGVNYILADNRTHIDEINNNIKNKISSMFGQYIQPELDATIKQKLDDYIASKVK